MATRKNEAQSGTNKASSFRWVVSLQMNTLINHNCVWILLCCSLKTLVSSRNSSDCLGTVVDLRDQSPYHYNQSNHWIGVLPQFNTLSISFDLKVMKPRKGFLRDHLLSFEGPSARLSFYLNGWGNLRIMHYNQELDNLGHDVNLLDGNQIYVPLSSVAVFNHFKILILNGVRVGVNIGEYSLYHRIDREICPPSEIMDIWLNREGLKASNTNAVIKNLVITAM